MLYRPSIYLRAAHHRQWQPLPPPPKPNRLQFHTSARVLQNDSPPNHYETLGVAPDASPGDIKKQFYTLSKRHHPDLHPTDPTASQRFVAITTAYTTLSDPASRRRYDASIFPASSPSSSSSAAGRSGSYSSASSSSPAGGRPASGLSKRRGAFRGPPPSFYRSGGWGAQAGKRRANAGFRHAEAGGGGSSAGTAGAGAGDAEGGLGGGNSAFGASEGGAYAGAAGAFGAGQSGMGFDDSVPHFDREGHFRTQQKVEGRRMSRRSGRGPVDEWGNEIGGEGAGGGSLLMSFFVLTGVVAGCVVIPTVFMGAGSRGTKENGRGREG